ncbi:sugar transferase, PEP-CTERM system associated/exopolysaccharide biosynthesis polyprenyl glycosylphosphotransferase [Desulfacinum hydrothermale DSM 13146]|uniref:Sugar transferase, PEP-CTERM system associated/exopolysaccharide biosynthesis polyprenyl glycosylphosphotransferase n=1 Tax=Desulfacinum hydrothermale DSM 13146 TaxID=1121390 RepID=A0A1W1XQZ8_9BACT|nr:TIGR03013 family XrtA/PEP-CTERM system glycosyltransferase [Desulfacinum hydrothermale]SMC26409.1 sugar transferase, PEP-CTERM system associated/exopolysaccharide biosynthesis polyprenyl glycosylphosphotransferase [Desulfacinum hydrothermale DSM 13146]
MLKFFHTYFPIRNLLFFLGEGGLIFGSLLVASHVASDLWYPVSGARHSMALRMLITTVVVQLSLYYHELYEMKARESVLELAIRLLQALGVACILLAALYAMDAKLIIANKIFFLALFLLVFGLLSWRFAYQYICERKLLTESILLLGNGQMANLIAREINRNLDSGYVVRALVEPQAATDRHPVWNCPVYRDYDTLCERALEDGIRRIVVALDERRGNFPVRALLRCKMMGISVLDGVSFFEALSGRIPVEKANPSWLIFSEGFRRHRLLTVGKRCLDIAFALIGLVLSAPIMLVVACAVKFTSEGPVFFRQERVGQYERPIVVVKFRTMVKDAEKQTGAVWASDSDPRVTPVGRVLRKLRLDELPQFWNVLKGDMSFVGPRPERPVFVARLKEQIPFYGERHVVKPGITGWAQVNYGYGASEEDALRKLEYDLFYIKHMSLFLDLYVILKTVQIVLFGKGAR